MSGPRRLELRETANRDAFEIYWGDELMDRVSHLELQTTDSPERLMRTRVETVKRRLIVRSFVRRLA